MPLEEPRSPEGDGPLRCETPDRVKQNSAAARGGVASTSQRMEPKAPLRWKRGEMIGVGAFGRVYVGMDDDKQQLLAVKEVSPSPQRFFAAPRPSGCRCVAKRFQVLLSGNTMEKAMEHLKGLESEVEVLRQLSHPNIVRYLGTERTATVRLRQRQPKACGGARFSGRDRGRAAARRCTFFWSTSRVAQSQAFFKNSGASAKRSFVCIAARRATYSCCAYHGRSLQRSFHARGFAEHL